jgi:hypothetical protein
MKNSKTAVAGQCHPRDSAILGTAVDQQKQGNQETNPKSFRGWSHGCLIVFQTRSQSNDCD